MATIDLGKIKLVWKGTYAAGTAYTPDDVVEYTDTSITSSYICTTASTGNAPSSGGTAHGSWAYMAKGVAGSPLTTRGDIIRRGASADERLAKGTEGQILTMGADDPAWAAASAGGANPNIIMNGDGNICQRDTSVSGVQNGSNEGFYCWDRWATFIKGGTTAVTNTYRSADAPTDPKFGSSLKFTVTTADTSAAADAFYSVYQPIEAQLIRSSGWNYSSSSSNLTLSFWVKSPKTGTHCVWCETADGTVRWITKEYTVSAANTWEKKSFQIAGNSNLQIDHNEGRGFLVGFVLQAGTDFHQAANTWSTTTHYATTNQVNCLDNTSNIFLLTGIKLEVGDTATAWQPEDITVTLNKCRRYYQKIDVGHGTGPQGGSFTSTTSSAWAQMHPPMRAKPSFGHNGTVGDYRWQKGDSADSGETVSALAIGTGSNKDYVRIDVTHSGNTNVGDHGCLGSVSSGDSWQPLTFTAEI